MATTNQLIDQYAIETIVKDESAAALNAVTQNLKKTEDQARRTAAELTGTGNATGTLASGVEKAVATLDRMANKGDAVTAAYNRLQKAQGELAAAQQAANRAMEAGEQDLGKIERTLATFAERVDTAAKKLGEQRAIAAANEATTSAWTGAIGEGSAAISSYATKVAAATSAAAEMQIVMAKAAGSQAELNRILGGNASGENFAKQLSAARAEIDPLYAASMRYATALQKIDDLEVINAVSANVAEGARKRLNDAYSAAVEPISMATEAARKAAEVSELVYTRKIAEAQAVKQAAEAQAFYSSTGSQGSTRGSQQITFADAGAAQQSAASLGSELDTLGTKYGTANAALQQFAQWQKETNILVANGDLTLSQQVEILDTLSGKTAEAVTQFNKMAVAQEEAAAAAAKQASENEELRKRVDPVYRLSQSYAAALTDLQSALDKNLISQKQFDIQLTAANAGYQKTIDSLNKMAGGSNAAGYAARFMGIQFIQAASGIATGQDIMTVAIQQGHQLFDVYLAMGEGIKSLGQAFLGMFNAIGGFPVAIIAAAGVALGFLTAAGNNSIGMMNQLKIALQGNHENFAQLAADVESAARVIAGTTRLTLDEAVSGIKTITQNRYFDGAKADMVDLSKLAINLAASLGKDASEGFSLLNEAMLNPLETAKKLSGNFSRELSPAFIDQLEKTVGLTNQFYKLRDALTAATGDNARQSMSPIRDAWVDLGNAFSSGTNGWKPFEEFLANTFATSIRMVAGEVRGLGDAFSTMGGQLKGAWENAKSLWEFLQKTPKQTAAESQQAIEQANQQGMPARGSGYSVDSWTTSQNQAAQTITNVLASEFQATESQIIATIANGFRETGLTASKLITDSNGYQSGGFLQWNAKYGRLQGMYSDSGTTDINQIDLATQVRYMMKEIANSPTLSAMWKDMATMTGADAAALFTKQFENPRNANQQGQISANIAGQLTGGTTTISNNILNEDTITLEKAYGFAADSTAEKLAKLTTKYDEVQAAMQLVGVTMGTQSGLYLGLSQQADKLSAAIANEKTAEQQQADQFESTMRATAGATEGLRAYNAFIEQARLNAVNAKGIFTFADELQAQSQFLRQQSQALGQVGDALTEATLKNDRLSNSYKNGDQAVLNATAKEQAIQQVMQHLPPTLAQVEAAIAALTQRYLALAQSAAKIQEVQILRQQSNSIAYINAETSSVGLGEQAQSRYLAVFKATQEAHQRDGDTLTDLSNKIIDNTGKINDATAAYQSQKNALSELQSFYDTVFSDVGNTITDAFAIGSDKALRFKDVVTSVVNDIEKEFVKLALTNPLKNLIFGTNSATLDSVGGILGSLFGSSDVTGSSITGVGSIAALLGLAGSGSKSSSGSSPFDSSGITVSGSSTNSSSGGISTTGVATSALGLVGKVGTLEEFGKLLSGNYTGNALGAIGRIGSYSLFSNSSGAIGQTVPDAAVDAVNTAGGSVSDTGTLAGGSGAINVTVGQALGAVGGLYSAYSGFQRGGVGGTVQGVTGLASAGLAAASTGLLGTGAAGLAAAAGPYAPIALAAIALISAFLPSAHPLHSYQATEVNVAGGQLGIGRTVSQVESADETINNVQEWEKSINQYMSATKIKLTNPDSTIGSVGEGIKNFTQVDNPNALFSELMFANDPSDTSSFGTGKGALTGMRFNSIDELQNELVKIANFTDTLDAVGIKLESVGTDLTNIRIKEVIDAGANDLRTALSHDLPGQVFANTDALDAEINKVNTFVNSTVPGLLQPVEQTSSSITEAADKVKTMYADAINQATAYGLDYTQKLQAAEEQALLLVRREGIEAITDRGNQLANAARDMSGSTANYLQETMDSFDSTTRDTLEAISKEWTDTYGDAVKTNTGYLAAIAFAEKEFGQERVKAVFEAMNQIEQATASQAQTEGKITSRGLTVTGGQPALAKAALSDAGNSNALELAQYKKTLEQFYGFNFVDTKAYNDKITELTTVQNEENYAIAKKYSDALIAGYEKIGDRITKLVNAARDMYGSTANYYQETMDNFDATTRDTLAAISKEWTDTYGDLITTSTDYLTAMAFAEKELGAERVKAAFEAINQAEQARATEAQTEAKVTIRGLNATGAPGQAALLENDTAAALELAQYKKTLESFYGITYVNTQEYNDKISELERVQGLERVAIVQKYAKDTTGVINLAFEKQHTAYTDAQSAFKAAQSALVTALNSQISATNSQISAIKSNNDALHSASTTIKNFLSGVGTSAESPLTPTQQLSDATTQFKTYVNTALHGNTVAERTGAAGNATNAASTLLQKASAYYGQASGGYADIFKMVNSNLTDASTAFDASAVTGDQQLDVLNKQLVVQQAQLDKANALGKDADTNTAALEAVMIAKFNDMITALYRVNQVDPNAQTLSDADRLRQQGSDAGLLDKYGEALYFQKLNIDSLSATGETAANLLYGFQHGQTGGEFGPGLDILLDRNKIYPPGTIGHYASGGFVKNGTWNKDSVNSELAGGEFVVRAAEAAKFANILPDINSGAYDPDINRQLLNEIKGLKDEVIQLKAQSIRNGQIAAQGSLAVVNAVSGDMQQKMAAIARENLARKRINNG